MGQREEEMKAFLTSAGFLAAEKYNEKDNHIKFNHESNYNCM